MNMDNSEQLIRFHQLPEKYYLLSPSLAAVIDLPDLLEEP